MSVPERIYGWLNSHLSIARHYGGCTINGHRYVIDYDDPEQPLVRIDVATPKAKRRRGKTGPNPQACVQGQLLPGGEG